MPKFSVIYLVENVSKDETDNRMFILYDSTDYNYYYYGTRSRNSIDKYREYSGKYAEYNHNSFIVFLKHVNDLFRNKIDTELHFIDIDEDEYDNLTFMKLFEKINYYTEIFAYENVVETEETISEKLKMIKNN